MGESNAARLLYDRALFWLCRAIADWFGSSNFCFDALQCTRVFNDTFYFAKRDAVYVLLSLATCYLTSKFLLLNGEKWHAKIFLLAIVLLILVLGIGTSC